MWQDSESKSLSQCYHEPLFSRDNEYKIHPKTSFNWLDKTKPKQAFRSIQKSFKILLQNFKLMDFLTDWLTP